ncbi:Spy0128 family protein [Parolsenella catena]|uniref:Spy0128 family protein n=1 Tax=Parolsenella catena TaxID=2003188 RepID=UPI002E795166|nr:FctA domain-containing protein [Parolsenella catena]
MLSRHIAISSQGVRKAFGRVRHFGVALAAGAFVAIIGLVGAPSPALAIPETTVSTVSPSGMTINLFDYWVTDAQSNSISGNSGINSGHQLQFTDGRGDGINGWSGSGAPTSYVSSTLSDDGYPQIAAGTHGSDRSGRYPYTSESLAYLFDWSTRPGKEAHLGVKGLLQTIDGYYEYDSQDNFASYDAATNSFKVYDSPAVEYDGPAGKFNGMFFPFNSASQVNANTSAESSTLNHHFGLSMSTQFIQPAENGVAGMTDYNGSTRDMEFEFSGDDDVWVYIDDVLVGDLGGIHDLAKLNINFRTGDVKVNDKSVGTLKSLFEAAGVSTGNFSGDTFAADSQHTLKFYYLERGAAASNMHLKFNLVSQPVSELLKIDQNGNPVQGAKFELYEADENYNVSGDPIATGTTDANGQLYFTNVSDHSVISFDKEAVAGTTHFVLKEIGVPDGYHSSVTSYDGTMHLEYVRSQHEGGSSGGTLQSPTDTQDGFTVNRRWLNGGYVASKETLTVPSDLRAEDGSSAIKPSTSKGTMFAVVYMKDDDGTWKALVGDAVNGYKTVGNGDLAGAIEAVRQQGGSAFALTTSGQYQVELNDLPGDARDYVYMMASDQMANAKYTVAVYYTTANTLDGATEDNTVRVNTDNFTRQFAAKLLVTNVQNRLFVQKVDEKGNPVSGATFSLYAADSVEDDGNGNYRVKDGAQPIDSVTTGSMTFPYSLEGAASFPLDSTNKRALTNGTYYLAETGAPDGYHANDTVTKVIVDNSGVYVDAGSEGDGVRSMSSSGSLLSALSQYGSGDSVDETLAKVAGTLESATETEDGLIWGECTAQGITPADVNTNPMKMSYSPEVSSSGDVLKYVTSDGSLPIIYADTGINRMRIQQDGKPEKGDNLGTMRLNQLFTSATGVQYTDQRVARLEVTKQVTSDSGVTAPSTDANGADLTFEYTFRLPSNGLLGSGINNTQGYDAQVFDASGNAVGDSFKLKAGDKHAIKAGETIRVYGLSAGDQFSVTETGKHEDLGFSLVSRKKGNEEQRGEGDAISGTIVETTSSGDISQNNRLTFTNNYSPIPATLDGSASLRVTKSLVNEDGSARDWDEGDAFTFTLAPGDEATADAVKEGLITLPDNASGLVISRDAANHASEFGDITFKVAGTFTFDVAESRGADAKPSTAYDTSVKHVRVSVADKGNGQLAASVERSSDTLAFTNIYKAPKKVYRAGDDAKASIDGQTVSAGDKITYELAWVNNTGADARVSVTDTLPQGVEFVGASDGGTPSADGTAVTWDLGQQPTDTSGTVTLTVRVTGVSDEAGTDEIANTAKVTVGENSYDTNTVTVKAEKCSLEISKTVEGGDPNREFTFDVTLGNADGTPFAGTLGAKRYSEGQDTPEDVSVTFDAEGKAQLTLKAGQRIVVSRLSKSARYTVREQPAAGYTATVNGQDGSEATGVLDSGVTSVSFNNAYATDTYVAHTDNLFSKTLVGRDWADGESFSFTMTLAQGDASGVTYNGSAIASKPASGNKATFGFGDMTFTRPGTYVFDVTEDGASAAGLKKDTHTATLTVTVRDDGLGHLVVDGAVPAIVSDGDFTNTYSSNLDYGVAGGLKLEKTLDGHAMAAGQFQFTLKAVDEDGAVAASESAALLGLPEAGKVFDSPASDDGVAAAVNLLPDDDLVLTQANANKTYAFELTETRGGGAGYTNDSQVHKVRIAVTDDGAGTLTATTTVDGTAYVYKTGDSGVENPAKVYLTNSYQASGEATIKAEKVLRGRDQVAGEFHFTVTDKQGSTVATGTNAADGAITFDKPLSYTQADVGTHAYTVTETGNLPSGVRGIVTQLAVEVSVTDNGDGTLRASVAYPDGADHLTFVNEYGADASASVSLNGTKSYDAPAGEGYATPDIEGKFAFTLTGADGAPMPSGSDGQAKTVRNAAGNVDFGEVAYIMADAGKTYEYTIAEAATDDSPKGVSVDGGTRVVRVSVTDNGDGTISATATDGDGNSLGTGSKFSFTNAYRVTQTSATIQGTKSLEGRELRDGEFTFELLEDGRQVAMTSNDAEGRFSFDLTYDKPGEHEYVVREVVPGETRGVSFDTHEAVAHVSVSDNGAGALVANVTYPGGDVSFKNTYAAEGTSARIVAVKRLEGATLADGQFTFQLSDAETGTVLQSATNAADGSVTFALGYGAADAGKTFTYKVSERNDGQAGVTYDGSSYTVKVEVTDDGEGHLSAKASTDDYLVFTNRYDAGGSGENPGGSPDVETPPAKQLPQTSDPLAGPGLEASIAVAGIAAIVVAVLVRRRG